MSNDFVLVETYTGRTAFWADKDMAEMDVVTIEIGGGAPDGADYVGKFRMNAGVPEVKVTFDDGTNSCDSGWVTTGYNIEVSCTSGATGIKARLIDKGLRVFLRFDSIWDENHGYEGFFETDANAGMALLDAICLGGLCKDAWYTNSKYTNSHTITINEISQCLIMDSADNKIFTLPSVGEDNDGDELEFANHGTGKLTIQAVDSDTIDDASDTKIETTDNRVATLKLKYMHNLEMWAVMASNGRWTTA